jgi:hypothetical protein
MALVMQIVKTKGRDVSKKLVKSSEKLIAMEVPKIDVMVGGIVWAQKEAPVRKAALMAHQRAQSPRPDKMHPYLSHIHYHH